MISPRSPIRVLLVEDSPVALVILKRLLATDPEIQVVGSARNGREALELLPNLQPTVICTDLHMGEMDGLEFTRRVMTTYPRPILVISASVQKDDTRNIFQLLDAGAVDIFPKPEGGSATDYEVTKQELISKIKILAGVKVFTQHRKEFASSASMIPSGRSPSPLNSLGLPRATTTAIRVIAIGASTGGPQTLSTVLKPLPEKFPVPLICIQHISEGFLQGLVSWLASECRLKVKVAQVGEAPLAGTVYFAPERHHLELDFQGRFCFSKAPPVTGHCPSITVTFQSIAAFYRQAALGILLTGMGRDGAEGLLAIAQAGGTTIAQDEKSSVVFGMPKEAIALGAAQHILPATEITPLLLRKVMPWPNSEANG